MRQDAGIQTIARRFSSSYATFAIIMLNTMILFLISISILDLVLLIKSRQPVYSRLFDLDSYTRIDRTTARQVGLEFDRMGEAASYEFYPWTVFVERAFDGTLVGVTEKNVRRTIPPVSLQAGQKDLLIWIFGGSTVFGWGMPDSQTIASHLQGILQNNLHRYRARVVNYGHSFYFSSMELSLYVALLRTEERPAIVLFLDGLNDAGLLTKGRDVPYFSDAAYNGWEQERQQVYGSSLHATWFAFNEFLFRGRLGHAVRRLIHPSSADRLDASRYYRKPLDPVRYALAQYRFNREAIRAIGHSFGIETYQFLQPIRGYGTYKAHTIPADSNVVQFFDALISEPFQGFYPINDAILNLDHPFVDTSHYSDEGSFRIAQRMAAIIEAHHRSPAP